MGFLNVFFFFWFVPPKYPFVASFVSHLTFTRAFYPFLKTLMFALIMFGYFPLYILFHATMTLFKIYPSQLPTHNCAVYFLTVQAFPPFIFFLFNSNIWPFVASCVNQYLITRESSNMTCMAG